MTKERLKDLAEVSFSQGRYTFTHFLSLAEQDEFYTIEPELQYAGITVSGGCDGTERQMIRFGNPEEFGYEEEFPISCIHCRPMQSLQKNVITGMSWEHLCTLASSGR